MQLMKYVVLIAALVLPAVAFAHGGGEHLMGMVQSIDEKGLTLETRDKKSVDA